MDWWLLSFHWKFFWFWNPTDVPNEYCIQNKTLISKDKILQVNPENKPRDLQAQIQEKDTASRGQQEKPRERQWAPCRHLTCLLTSPRAFKAFLWSSYGPPKCWPNTDCQLFLQQKKKKKKKLGEGGYLGSADNCNSGSATMVSHMQVPVREAGPFYRG